MKRNVCFIGALQLANCNSNYHSSLIAPSKVGLTRQFTSNKFHDSFISIRGGSSSSGITRLEALSSMYASLFAGSVGGAIGVGVSYPFDTLSTKAQVTTISDEVPSSHIGNVSRIFKEEGISGFFEGVLITMLGQAIIKAIQFTTNGLALSWLEKNSSIKSTIAKMTISGVLSGLVSSFVVSPVELVKIRMQAQDKVASKNEHAGESFIYSNEFDCARWVIKHEGWATLFTHGLWITIIREIPSFAIYFVVYGWLARSSLAASLGDHFAPLLFGAIAGWAMWIPTYPIDIVKTLEQIQTREKNKDIFSWTEITGQLYKAGGICAFFEGLEPKLARAAIKHSVTFWSYELMMKLLHQPAPVIHR
ncbi:hypothetical protein HJC23_008480 [Cyclotella cryptica]|uniref:Mitochondrial carrier protein n=1 Tax=Cyclotella cryptica TaxID=29204 RepID=A0ABD3QWM6_9STRA|eukprot:CCRYP_001220-RA/>CCRYP_001220-RA protein AED:0.28 eAED:0.28 QI:455/1/1/1/1/1/2/569/362